MIYSSLPCNRYHRSRAQAPALRKRLMTAASLSCIVVYVIIDLSPYFIVVYVGLQIVKAVSTRGLAQSVQAWTVY